MDDDAGWEARDAFANYQYALAAQRAALPVKRLVPEGEAKPEEGDEG